MTTETKNKSLWFTFLKYAVWSVYLLTTAALSGLQIDAMLAKHYEAKLAAAIHQMPQISMN